MCWQKNAENLEQIEFTTGGRISQPAYQFKIQGPKGEIKGCPNSDILLTPVYSLAPHLLEEEQHHWMAEADAAPRTRGQAQEKDQRARKGAQEQEPSCSNSRQQQRQAQ